MEIFVWAAIFCVIGFVIAYWWPILSTVGYLFGHRLNTQERALLSLEEVLDIANARLWNEQEFDEDAYFSVIGQLDEVDWAALKRRVDSGQRKVDKAEARSMAATMRSILIVTWLRRHTTDRIAWYTGMLLNPPVAGSESILFELEREHSTRQRLLGLREKALRSYAIALIKLGKKQEAIVALRMYIQHCPEHVFSTAFQILSAHASALENASFVSELEKAARNSSQKKDQQSAGSLEREFWVISSIKRADGPERIRAYEARLSEFPLDDYRPRSSFPARDRP